MIRAGRRLWLFAVVVTLLVWLPAILDAQIAQVKRAYVAGVKAFEAGDWSKAIEQLESAVKLDAKPDPAKFIDGGFRDPYFPFVYLAIAHLKLSHLDAAGEYFKKSNALERLPKDLASERTTFENQHAAAVRAAAPVSTTPPTPPVTPPPTPDPAAIKAATAAQFVVEAQQLLGEGKLAAADKKFADAEALSAGIAGAARGRAEIASRRSDYRRYKEAAQQDAAAGVSRAASAMDNLRKARAADPESFVADDLAPILSLLESMRPTAETDARTAAQQALVTGLTLASQGKYDAAEAQYKTALVLDPNNASAEQALERSRNYTSAKASGLEFERRRKFAEARQQLQAAQVHDPARFALDRLDAVLKRIDDALGAVNPTDLVVVTLRTAISAYLRGDSMSAITALERANVEGIDTRVRTDVQACLGVAYAARAYTALTDEERGTLKERALAQFRLVLAAEPAFQFSEDLVSPKIIQLFESARRGK